MGMITEIFDTETVKVGTGFAVLTFAVSVSKISVIILITAR